jgi:hypothetical protein
MSRVLSVFFVYRSVKRVPKSIYKTLNKRSLRELYPYVFSKAGFEEGGELRAAFNKAEKALFRRSEAVFITDIIPGSEEDLRSETDFHFLAHSEKKLECEIFTFRKAEEGYELWLNYSGNRDYIGFPERDDFFMLSLEKQKPVKILINGKLQDRWDTEPYYFEHTYLVEYSGEFPVQGMGALLGFYKRKLPLEKAKEINLRRLFY